MREIVEIPSDEIIPDKIAILKSQGISKLGDLTDKVNKLCDDALKMFAELNDPIGVYAELSKEDFEEIYEGEGENEVPSPVAQIFPRAKRLALFALTVGSDLSDKVVDLFDKHDYALGSMLDSVASEAAENGGQYLTSYYLQEVSGFDDISIDDVIMRYSPGYCGWHISGQGKLFEYLNPEEIGIELNDSYLMLPLKSISGVMIIGPREIHNFEMAYRFCDSCKGKGCRERINGILKH
jgi:hypothetical protein